MLSLLKSSNFSLSLLMKVLIVNMIPENNIAQEIRIGHTAGPGTPLRESGNSFEKYKAIAANNIKAIAATK